MNWKKIAVPAVVLVVLAGVAGGVMYIFRQPALKPTTVNQNPTANLPINTIPVESRPFVTMAPDSSGHYVTLTVDKMTDKVQTEYELVYNTSNNNEDGALGHFDFGSESQPAVRKILLGTQSAGGAITFSEGVSAGSLTLSTDKVKLKEDFNFLHFDPKLAKDQDFPSTDGYFDVTIPAKSWKADTVVIVMKTFGLPAPVPAGKLVAGPYTFQAGNPLKTAVPVSVTLPAGQYQNLVLYTWGSGAWVKVAGAKVSGSSLSANSTGTIFIVTNE